MAASRRDVNYDESKVPAYTLPDPLILNNGEPVTDAQTWYSQRRPEILELFKTHVYGKVPGPPTRFYYEIFEEDSNALDGRAVRKQVWISFTGDSSGPGMEMLIYLPKEPTNLCPFSWG